MKEIINSFLDTSKDRIKNPLIGTFIFSWIAINWRPLLILIFSEKKIEDKIKIIITNYSSIYTYLIFPLVIALIYVIVLPYIMWAIEELVRKSTIGRKKNIVKQIIADYEGKQEIAEQESKLEDLKASYRDKADFNNQIEQLRNQIDEREEILKQQFSEINKLNEENSSLKNIISNNNSDKTIQQNDVFENLYEEFKKTDMYDYFRDIGIKIRNERNFPIAVNEIIKEKYLFQGIIEEIQTENDMYYQFTAKGLYFWRKYVNNIKVSKSIRPNNNFNDDLPF